MELKYTLEDIVASAVMEKSPVVIVEGKDDRQIYQRIADMVSKNIRVYQIIEFENYAAGCEHVIDAMKALQPKFEERPENIHLILGIIDRDSRTYTGNLPAGLKGVFITKYYSIETYFATRANLTKLINKMSYTVPKDINESVMRFVEQNIEASFPDLYLISLEALQKICDESYPAVIGYSSVYHEDGKVTELKESKVYEKESVKYLISRILPKKHLLESFAKDQNLNISDLKLIAKGKWYLFNYVYRANAQIEQLSAACRASVISQCQSCKAGEFNDCHFKTKRNHYKPEELYHDILEFIDADECSDIIEAFQHLKP